MMDLDMPVMDGFEASRLILAYQQKNDIMLSDRVPIVAVTAFDDETIFMKCKAIGMADALTKPLD